MTTKMKIVRTECFWLVAVNLIAVNVDAILSKTADDKSDSGKGDSKTSQTTIREYPGVYDDDYGRDGLGLSAHLAYDLPQSGDGYEGYSSGKHHGYYGHHHGEEPHLLHHHHLHHVHKHHGDDDHHHHHHHDAVAYHKALAIKGLLVPLAGVALLGAAAAFISNPILLQLGVISGAPLGRRKREIDWRRSRRMFKMETERKLREAKVLEAFLAQVPEREMEAQEKRMMANYFTCSGPTVNITCLERLLCELHSPLGLPMPMESKVLSVIVGQVIGNDFIPDDTKMKITRAIQMGKKSNCQTYACDAFEDIKTNGQRVK